MLKSFIDGIEISGNGEKASQTSKFPLKKGRLQKRSFEMKWHVCFFFKAFYWRSLKNQDGTQSWAHDSGTKCNVVTEILGCGFFMQSRCCRECNLVGILQLLQSTQPGQYRTVGQWPGHGNWPLWEMLSDPLFSESSCSGEKCRFSKGKTDWIKKV